jgi:hypothetical protein
MRKFTRPRDFSRLDGQGGMTTMRPRSTSASLNSPGSAVRVIKAGVLFLLLATASGCATVGQYFREKGLSRAAFDLGCPSDHLQLDYLTDPENQVVSFQSQVGVSGCGKRITYVIGPNGQWIANSAARD